MTEQIVSAAPEFWCDLPIHIFRQPLVAIPPVQPPHRVIANHSDHEARNRSPVRAAAMHCANVPDNQAPTGTLSLGMDEDFILEGWAYFPIADTRVV